MSPPPPPPNYQAGYGLVNSNTLSPLSRVYLSLLRELFARGPSNMLNYAEQAMNYVTMQVPAHLYILSHLLK